MSHQPRKGRADSKDYLRSRHELSERCKALPHGHIHIALIHHSIPSPVHCLINSLSLWNIAQRVPRHIPEVAEVEARDASLRNEDKRKGGQVSKVAIYNGEEGAMTQGHHTISMRLPSERLSLCCSVYCSALEHLRQLDLKQRCLTNPISIS